MEFKLENLMKNLKSTKNQSSSSMYLTIQVLQDV